MRFVTEVVSSVSPSLTRKKHKAADKSVSVLFVRRQICDRTVETMIGGNWSRQGVGEAR